MPVYCIDLTAHNTLARHRGIGRYGYYLANALHRLKGELGPDERLVAAVKMGGAGAITDEIRPQFHEQPLPPLDKQGTHYSRYFLKRWLLLQSTLRAAKPTVVHFIEGPQMLPSRAYRSVVTCHDIIPLLMPKQYIDDAWRREPLLRAKDYLRYQIADRIIAVSHATANDLAREMRLSPSRLTVVQQGVDHEVFRPDGPPGEREQLAARYGLPKRYSIYVGANDHRKRVELLVRAYAMVFKATGVPLVVVGAWTETIPRSMREAFDALPPGAVIRLGEVPGADLPGLYRGADVHALPSVYEGFGLTVLEAMACGCPVVTTRGGALAEAAGDAARFVTEDSLTELEGALAEVLREPGMRAEMRERGLRHAARFTWERSARATLDVYRRAAGRVQAPQRAGAGAPA